MRVCTFRGCGREFERDSKSGPRKYCSLACRDAGRRLRNREYGRAYHDRNQVERVAAMREWRANNPDARRQALIRRYGITEGEYDALLASQGGVCAICGSENPGKRVSWHVDHDHACCPTPMKSCGNCVRGLLCRSCNMALGSFRDDVAILRSAIRYLGGEE